MLCDLFVDPAGAGQRLRPGDAFPAVAWHTGGGAFSHRHAHALPLYARFGLDAWWPLLYLRGAVAALRPPAGWQARPAAPAEVAALELAWTGVDRSADYRAWAGRPGGAGVLVGRRGQVAAAGVAGGADGEYGLIHLVLAPFGRRRRCPRPRCWRCWLACSPAAGSARVCLPGPHPAVRALLADRLAR